MWFFGSKGASGFSARSTAEEVTHGVDGTGLTAIVTGASSGIGVETARVLALRGVHVVMAVRNTGSGAKVKEDIVNRVPGAKLDVMELDLSSMDSVRKFASDYKSSGRDDSLTAYALQITLFPGNGFSIGVTAHHAVLDGKTTSMFFKAWAHVCREGNSHVSLPDTLTPCFNRSLIKDQTGLDEQMIEILTSMQKDKTKGRRRTLSPRILAQEPENDVVLATLVLSRDDVERLRERVEKNRSLHLSTFVVAYAYVWTCLVKAARGGNNGERLVSFFFSGDMRERLDPPLPATYFGNCIFPAGSYNRKAAEFEGEEGFVTAVETLSGLVKGLGSRKIETIAEEFKIGFDCLGVTSQFGSVAGSTRLGVYQSDFGWGKPVKTDVVSIQGEGISMGERRGESGGVEIGVCMRKADMDVVLSLFNSGLQN